MKRMLRSPITNAVGLSIFTAFYASIIILTAGQRGVEALAVSAGPQLFRGLWTRWSEFLASGYHIYMACAVIAVTVVVVLMLLRRRRAYDEYHTGHLLNCLAAASILTLCCIAAFALLIALDPLQIALKFMLFITIHWVTVVLADAAYVFLCRWR